MRLLILMILALYPINAEGANYEILDKQFGPALFSQCSRPSPQSKKFFRPTDEEIAKLEESIDDISKIEAVECCIFRKIKIERPHEFHRQYIGYYHGKRRLIYLNASPLDDSWRKPGKPAMVCDGGPRFWGVSYDPATGKFFDLATNGLM